MGGDAVTSFAGCLTRQKGFLCNRQEGVCSNTGTKVGFADGDPADKEDDDGG